MMFDVLIHSPFPVAASQGNSVTANRLEGILTAAGWKVGMGNEFYQSIVAKMMVALNARRSADAVAGFADECPGGKVIVILTGTDINHADIKDRYSPTYGTLRRADALVVLHDEDLRQVPEEFRHKTRSIYPSVRLPQGLQHQPGETDMFRVIMAGNLRAVKNPGLAVQAAKLLDGRAIQISSYGDVEASMAGEIERASAEVTGFQWAGPMEQLALIGKMAQSHVLLNTSTQEGGANAICEAVCLGLPVLASRVRGNVGMLGNDYLGYFPSGDSRALADLLARCQDDPVFYRELKSQVANRAELFSYETEATAWQQLVRVHLGQ